MRLILFIFLIGIFSKVSAQCDPHYSGLYFSFPSTDACLNNIRTGSVTGATFTTTYNWLCNDTSFSNSYIVNWTASRVGEFTIKVEVTDPPYATCVRNLGTFKVLPNPSSATDFEIGSDKSVCTGESVTIGDTLTNSLSECQYLWNTGAATPFVTVSSAGTYSLKVSNKCGSKTDNMTLKLLPKPTINLGSDKVACSGTTTNLDAGVTGASSYLWSTGETTQQISVNQTNISVWVKVDSIPGCAGSDTINITECPVEPQVPTAFTPNGDGKNDVLYVRGNNISDLTFVVYNRLGTKVFETNSLSNGWDGKLNGIVQEDDVYVYILKVKLANGTAYEKSGQVMLLK